MNATEGRAASRADTADLETRGTIKIETLVSFGGPRYAHDAQEAQEEQAEEQDLTDEEHDASTALTVHQPTQPSIHIDTLFLIDDHFWATANPLEKMFATWVLFYIVHGDGSVCFRTLGVGVLGSQMRKSSPYKTLYVPQTSIFKLHFASIPI